MADVLGNAKGSPLLQRWRSRLVDRLTLLLSILIVFLGLVGLEYIDPLPALCGYVLVVVVALLIPGAVEIANPAAIGAEASDSIRDNAVRQVADALPDPCLILDRRSNVVHRNAPAIQAFPNLIEGNPIAFSMRSPAKVRAPPPATASGPGSKTEASTRPRSRSRSPKRRRCLSTSPVRTASA